MKLHEKLAALRTEKGLSQQELAELLHIARQSVSRWEVGDAIPTVENLRFLARLYGVTVDSLLDDDLPPQPSAVPSPKKYLTRRALCALLAVLLALLTALGILLWERYEEEHPTPLQFEDVPSESWDGITPEEIPLIW